MDFYLIGLRIKELRMSLTGKNGGAMNQREFADLMKVHQTYISEIERASTKPSLKILHNIIVHFDLTLDYLVYGEVK